MSSTSGLFTKRKWTERLCDTQETVILVVNGAIPDFAEVRLSSGGITLPPITSTSAASATDNAARRIYVITSTTNIDVWDIDTNTQLPSLVVTPALPAGVSWSAWNFQDNTIHAFSSATFVMSKVDPTTGNILSTFNVTGFAPPWTIGAASGGTALAIDPNGVHYLPFNVDVGGGNSQLVIYSFSEANPAATLFATGPTTAGIVYRNTGATWAADNRIYISSVDATGNLYSFDLNTNAYDFTEITAPFLGNSLGSYNLGPAEDVCFLRHYEILPDDTTAFTDTQLDGATPYAVTGIATCCGQRVISPSMIAEDQVLTTGQAVTHATNTLRSITIQVMSGTADVNGVTLPTGFTMSISEVDSNTNRIADAFVINAVTGETVINTTRYI